MNCRQANRLLPLWVGRDLADASEATELQVHLAECQTCMAWLRNLQESLDALQSVSTASLDVDSLTVRRPSLWTGMATVLSEVPRRRDRFNGWVPAGAMALAVTLMVAVSVVQVHREMGDTASATVVEPRDLFPASDRIAPSRKIVPTNKPEAIPVNQPANW